MQFKVLEGQTYRKYQSDAGYDIFSNEKQMIQIQPKEMKIVSSGLKVQIPFGYYGQIAIRSSFGIKGLIHLAGIIDSGYNGEIKVIVYNVSDQTININTQERFAQLIIIKIYTENEKEIENEAEKRNENGFGSTNNQLFINQ